MYDQIKANSAKIKHAIEENPAYWDGVYNELAYVVWCKIDDTELLRFELTAKRANGENQGCSRCLMLQCVDGTWKRSLRGSKEDRANQIYQASELAMKACMEGGLKARSVKALR